MSMRLLMESWRVYENEEQMIQERSIMKEKYPFKAIYVVGPAGAGKSYLGSQIGSFFESLQEIAASPADLAPRTVAIEKGRAMADSFQNLAMELESQRKSAQERAEQAIEAINIFFTYPMSCNLKKTNINTSFFNFIYSGN